MVYDVFISYSIEDQDAAEKICGKLESKGMRCWIAPRDVLPGAEWAEAIVDAIDDSRLMLLVFSASSNSSRQVMREVGRAASKDIPIVPVRIDDVPPSKSMQYFISSHHWLEAQTPPLGKHLQRIAESVQKHLTQEGETRNTDWLLEEKPKFSSLSHRNSAAESIQAGDKSARLVQPKAVKGEATMPIIAGTLNIVSGSIGFLFWGTVFIFTVGEDSSGIGVSVMCAIASIVAIVAILGGVYSIRKVRWGLAMAGAICAIFVFLPLGIPALILVASLKNYFT